jgi:UDP-N-acetylglucosamine 2-epimerase (non-hydrolysing)
MEYTVLHIVGARPNFMKVAPVMQALSQHTDVAQVLIHTGQHYDPNMSDVFLKQLGLPEPDLNLAVGSSSHARQTAEIMTRLEPLVLDRKPDLVFVYGDVNSTMAAALVCSKLGVRVAHVEAGLRSYDRTMPEEINRLVTDQLADLLFTPSEDANQNLLREGIPAGKIHLVGNVMIDTLVRLLPAATDNSRLPAPGPDRSIGPLGLIRPIPDSHPYILVTLHRPSNVDDLSVLKEILDTLLDISRRTPVIFPVHPRTRQRLSGFNGRHRATGLQLIQPVGYVGFLALMRHAQIVITDSGGIQEETTYLGVPCLTLRENTERPITVTMGTNTLVGRDMPLLRAKVSRIQSGDTKPGRVPPLWDGHAAERIREVIVASRRVA